LANVQLDAEHENDGRMSNKTLRSCCAARATPTASAITGVLTDAHDLL
jgi:hypothetical protein